MNTLARYSLAGIRLVNGTAGLLAPDAVARRLGVNPVPSPGMNYALRLFGVRTVILGLQLLVINDRERLDRALRVGTIIHSCDALAALYAGITGELPRRSATLATAISTVNVLLSVLARQGRGARAAGGHRSDHADTPLLRSTA